MDAESNTAPSVVAVVVTHNRLTLLQRCLDAIAAQSRPPDRTIVVDNGSTDGTDGWLRTRRDLEVVSQENLGCAAGVANGMRMALTFNPAYVWVMDDDGEPAVDCLAELLANVRSDEWAISPLVLCDNARTKLVYPVVDVGDNDPIALRKNAEGDRVKNIDRPWLGILFPASAIRRIGLPEARYVMWGEDIEYMQRGRKLLGQDTALALTALFYHPPARSFLCTGRVFGYTLHYLDVGDWRRHLMTLRNNAHVRRRYHGFWSLLRFFVSTVCGLLSSRQYAKALASALAIVEGMFGVVGNEHVVSGWLPQRPGATGRAQVHMP